MRFARIILGLCVMLVVGMTQAQTIHEADPDQDLLVDLTLQPSIGYQVYAYEMYLEVEYRYLGEAFDLQMAVYDSTGQTVYDGSIEDYASSGVELAGDEYLVVFYVASEASGRAIVRFNVAGTSHDGDAEFYHTSLDWSVSGDVVDPVFIEDKLCAQSNDGTWFFSAPQSFVEWVQTGYGDTIGFGLEQLQSIPEKLVVALVVGNGVILEYPLNHINYELTYHIVPLRANTGWVDIDDSLTEDMKDGEVFQELLANVTQVLIQGAGETCLLAPNIYLTTATAPHVPFYVFTYDEASGGLPSGCEGYIVELSSEVIYSDDPAENIRTSLEALFDYAGNDDLINYYGDQGLTVESVTVEDGFSTVEIGGTMMQMGSCVDGTMETQILLSVFNNPEIEGASITVNGRNMKPQFDMSDMTPEDETYTPADFSLRLYTSY